MSCPFTIALVCLGVLFTLGSLARRAERHVHRQTLLAAPLAGVVHADRPDGNAFWKWYQPVNYAQFNSGSNLQVAWHTIGGAIGDEGAQDNWLPCAAELSYALDRAGAPIPRVAGASNRNTDGRRYILSARLIRRYLRSRWGRPDDACYPVAACQPSSDAFLSALHVGSGVAVFATDHHVGVIKAGYADPILPYLGVADVWILPAR